METFASGHSLDRAKERLNIKNQRAAERDISRALHNGKRAEDFSSWERNFLLGEERDNCFAVAYNRFCYIFNAENVCVTLYPLPAWFGKKKRFDGKERIRDYKQYQMNTPEDVDGGVWSERGKYDDNFHEGEKQVVRDIDRLIVHAKSASLNGSDKVGLEAKERGFCK